MSETIIDARGRRCPEPLILAKKALEGLASGAPFAVLLDDETSCGNVERFLRDHGMVPALERDGRSLTLRATKAAAPLAASPEAWCAPGSPSPARPTVVQIASDAMGSGADDLGRLLLQAFVNTLKEISPAPAAVVFYNAGVRLACAGSAALPALAELESRGVKLLVCGTCLDFYELKPKRQVGAVSNMYDILTTLAGAGAVIRP